MSEQPGPAHGDPQWTPPGGPPHPATPAHQGFSQPTTDRPPTPYGHQPAYGAPQPAYPPPHPAYAPQQPAYAGAPPAYGPQPHPVPQPVPQPVPGPGLAPERIEPIAGTEFGVAYLRVSPTFSGLAVGSLVAGIASILVAVVVGCLGVALAQTGGAIGAGAFAVLAALLGLGGVGLGFAATRQVSAASGRVAGRGLAIAGLVCGGVGVLLTVGGFLLALALLAGSAG